MTVRYCGDVNSPPQALLFFFLAGFLAIALQVDHITQLTVTRFYIRVHPQSLFYISVTVITFSNRRIIASFCLRARRRYPLVHVLTKKIN